MKYLIGEVVEDYSWSWFFQIRLPATIALVNDSVLRCQNCDVFSRSLIDGPIHSLAQPELRMHTLCQEKWDFVPLNLRKLVQLLVHFNVPFHERLVMAVLEISFEVMTVMIVPRFRKRLINMAPLNASIVSTSRVRVHYPSFERHFLRIPKYVQSLHLLPSRSFWSLSFAIFFNCPGIVMAG